MPIVKLYGPSGKILDRPIYKVVAPVKDNPFRYWLAPPDMWSPNPDFIVTFHSDGKQIDIFNDIETDPKVWGALNQIKNKITSYPKMVVPFQKKNQDVTPKDSMIADFAEDVLLNEIPSIDDKIHEMLDGILKGYCIQEIVYSGDLEHPRVDNMVGVYDILMRHQRRFGFTMENEMKMMTRQNMIPGEYVPKNKFIHFRFDPRNDNPYGNPLGNKIFWWWWIKKEIIKFWATFLDKFGQPTALGEYARGLGQPEIDELLNILQTIQTESSIVIPDDTKIRLLEATRTGSTDGYKQAIEYCDSQIIYCILGQEGTSSSKNVGSQARDETLQFEVTDPIIQGYCKNIETAINWQLVRFLVDINFGPQEGYPHFDIKHEKEEDTKKIAEELNAANELVDLPEDWTYKKLGVPKPSAGEAVIPKKQFGVSGFGNPSESEFSNPELVKEFAKRYSLEEIEQMAIDDYSKISGKALSRLIDELKKKQTTMML